MHQGVEAGLGVAFLKSVFAQEDRFWFNVAYTYNDFFFDGDATWGNNRLPGVPPHHDPRRSTLQASERILRRSERRVDAAGLLRRQRQHAHGRSVRAVELQGRLRYAAPAGPAISKRETCSTHATSRPRLRLTSRPPPRRCSTRASAARSTAACATGCEHDFGSGSGQRWPAAPSRSHVWPIRHGTISIALLAVQTR